MKRKPLQEQTLKDNFMFSAVMMDPENCRKLLERVLEREIERVEVDREKSIIYNPEYRGIRLDVYAKDENNTHFNVEMQVESKELKKRIRYYHDQMDMDILLTNTDYTKLPDTYVIFLCDYDPFGLGKYRYTLRKCFAECPEQEYDDGSYTIILSTQGTNEEEVPKSLVNFLLFLSCNLQESEGEFADEYVTELQETIREVKKSREMGGRYMQLEELLRDEREEGRAEGRAEGLAEGRAEGLARGETIHLIKLVCRKLSGGKSAVQIAEALEEDQALIEAIIRVAAQFAPTYDAEQIFEAMQ